MEDVSKLFENNTLDTLVRDYNLDVITFKMIQMYETESYKNSNQSIENLVTMEEIVNVGGINESFVEWLMKIGKVYHIFDGEKCYYNFGEVMDKHSWYKWCESVVNHSKVH